jgi:hypothetical protein
VRVEMLDVFAQHGGETTAPDDQDVVEAFRA